MGGGVASAAAAARRERTKNWRKTGEKNRRNFKTDEKNPAKFQNWRNNSGEKKLTKKIRRKKTGEKKTDEKGSHQATSSQRLSGKRMSGYRHEGVFKKPYTRVCRFGLGSNAHKAPVFSTRPYAGSKECLPISRFRKKASLYYAEFIANLGVVHGLHTRLQASDALTTPARHNSH